MTFTSGKLSPVTTDKSSTLSVSPINLLKYLLNSQPSEDKSPLRARKDLRGLIYTGRMTVQMWRKQMKLFTSSGEEKKINLKTFLYFIYFISLLSSNIDMYYSCQKQRKYQYTPKSSSNWQMVISQARRK